MISRAAEFIVPVARDVVFLIPGCGRCRVFRRERERRRRATSLTWQSIVTASAAINQLFTTRRARNRGTHWATKKRSQKVCNAVFRRVGITAWRSGSAGVMLHAMPRYVGHQIARLAIEDIGIRA